MRWMKWLAYAAAVCMLMTTDGSAQVVGRDYAQTSQHLIQAHEGDPIWMPTLEQVTAWVNDGIDAAAFEMPLLSVPGVAAWGRSSEQGVPTSDGMVYHSIVLSPQLVATTTGWRAARDEAAWTRIQEDQNAVAGEIARQISSRLTDRDLLIIFVLGREPWASINRNGAVYYLREWRAVSMTNRGPLSDFLKDRDDSASPDRRWAAQYALSQIYSPTGAAELGVLEGQLLRNPTRGPDLELVSQIEPPQSTMRFVIGSPEEFAVLDF